MGQITVRVRASAARR